MILNEAWNVSWLCIHSLIKKNAEIHPAFKSEHLLTIIKKTYVVDIAMAHLKRVIFH